MFLSLRWLGRHVDLSGLSAEDVAEGLTIHTAEVEGIEDFAPALSDVVVGHVLERGPHPQADRLSLCRVDVGDGEPLQIVCGAPNVDGGQRVAVARIGTVLPGGVKLKRSKIRGVESQGMICSERELGLGDEHSGIWVLPGEPGVGVPVAQALDIVDRIIEIENKSLTHRPDLWGHRGIAGEVAAIHGRELLPLDLSLPETGGGQPYPVRVDSAGCTRYLGLPLSGVRVEESPLWLKLLLLAAGQRPIDLLVDLSNFVMLDLGQPNHLFDLGRLSSEGIHVRDARPGERMATLDDVERELTPEDVLICSGDEPVALAGIMGGQGSKVSDDTSELLLEVATFLPARIRRTAARLGLRSDASTRFEKYLDPTLPAKAAAHLVRTLREIQPGVTLPRAMGDAGDWTDPACTVSLRPARVREVLGADVPDEEIQRSLEALGFGIDGGRDTWAVEVPSARATKDVGIEEDLIEEVGRMFGYGNVPERAFAAPVAPVARDERRALVRALSDALAGAARFHEVMSHTFVPEELVTMLGVGEQPYVRVINPQSEGLDRVRREVLPSLLGTLRPNRRAAEELRFFEIGKGYRPEDENERGEPREAHELALIWLRPRTGEAARFDDTALARLQGVVEELGRVAARALPAWERAADDAVPFWAHPGRCLVSTAGNGEQAALLAVLEPGLQRELGLVGELDGDVACAQVSLDVLLALPEAALRYRPIPRFPDVKVDVALSLSEDVTAGSAVQAIEAAGKGRVAAVELFDLYRGEKLGAGRKSLAYHVSLQAPDKTLSDKDVAKFLSRLERGVAELGGELRRD